MITSRVMSAPSSAHPRRVANPSRSPRQADFADPLVVTTDLCPQAECTFRTPYTPWFALVQAADHRLELVVPHGAGRRRPAPGGVVGGWGRSAARASASAR